jgi:outer membrane protein with beta-barrel domain
MRTRAGLLVGVVMLAGAMPMQAQRPGTVEIGAFGRFTKFDSKLNFDNRLGVGARAGVYVIRNLAFEGDVTYTRTKSEGGLELRHTPIHARFIYNIPANQDLVVLLGAGYVRNLFRASYRETEDGLGGLLGVRYGLPHQLALRVDVTGDYIWEAESRFTNPPQVPGVEYKKSNFHLGLEAGLSFFIRGNR